MAIAAGLAIKALTHSRRAQTRGFDKVELIIDAFKDTEASLPASLRTENYRPSGSQRISSLTELVREENRPAHPESYERKYESLSRTFAQEPGQSKPKLWAKDHGLRSQNQRKHW